MIRAVGAALLALACALLAGALAMHHPLSAPLALAACVLLAAVACRCPALAALLPLPLLPLIGLMPWSGWLTVEELDLVVLAAAAGAYLRMGTGWPRAPGPVRVGVSAWLWLLPLALSTLVSLDRGVADAGGLAWGWWQGYREPLNSLRLAKPLFEVLLLLPLWRAACRVDEPAAARRLILAMTLLLLGVGLAVLWERLAFTGLLDFTSDYRATGPFWEMHVGGAALDAVLALSLPFAVAAWAVARTPARWAGAAAVLALGLYAAVVTFSRIVYAAVPLGLLAWWALRAWSRQGAAGATAGGGDFADERSTRGKGGTSDTSDTRNPGDTRDPRRAGPVRGLGLAWLLLGGFALVAAGGFPDSGYRGLLALLGAAALILPLVPVLRRLSPAGWVLGAGLGIGAAIAVIAMALLLPKGAYLAYAAAWVAAAAGLALAPRRRGPAPAVLSLAAFVATAAALAAVGRHWGGERALGSSVVAATLILLVAGAAGMARGTSWPRGWRLQGQWIGALAAVAAVVAIFGGGAYMGQRLAASASDGQGRIEHWRHALSLLGPADWVWGKGLGRYWANQALSGQPQDQTGDYRLLPPAAGQDGSAVVLTSGRHDLGSAEALRLSQRVPEPAAGPVLLRLDLRIEAPVKLQAEICEKHLLYPARCLSAEQLVQGRPGQWQPVQLQLKGQTPTRGLWFAPRLIVFSLSLGRHLNRAEIDHLQLLDAQGRELLVNGDFEHGLAHWFFSSDRYHLPWHLKNLALHLLFEQGLFGLGAFALAAAAALWRVSAGASRRHALAPVLAGSLLGLLIVGGVDSLLDMPRVAFLTLLLLAVALSLPADPPAPKPPPGP